jgi:ABC-type phosphate transport system substrate-binding protein
MEDQTMKVRLGRIVALAAVCMGAAFAVTAPAASAAVTCEGINGSGSSLQGVAQGLWGSAFALNSKGCTAGISVKYISTSSGSGLACWGVSGTLNKAECGVSGTLDAYIGTDVGPEGPAGTPGTQLTHMDAAGGGNKVVTVPVAQSAIAIIVTMPVGCVPKNPQENPRVQVKALEEEWNGSKGTLAQQIKFENPGNGWKGTSCQEKLTPTLFARSKGSGTTAGFKRFLDQVNPQHWETFVKTAEEAESIKWPNQQIKTSDGKSSEQAEKTFKTPNSMSYVDISDARKAGFNAAAAQIKAHPTEQGEADSFYVEVQNSITELKYIKPEEPSGEAACKKAAYKAPTSVGPDVDWSHAQQTNSLAGVSGEGLYPICTLTFDLAWHEYGLLPAGTYTNSTNTANAVLQYLTYIVSGGGQEIAALKGQEHFAALPASIKLTAAEGLEEVGVIKN